MNSGLASGLYFSIFPPVESLCLYFVVASAEFGRAPRMRVLNLSVFLQTPNKTENEYSFLRSFPKLISWFVADDCV